MRKLFTFTLMLFFTGFIYAQNSLGVSFNYSTSKAYSFDLHFGLNYNRFHIGYVRQNSGAIGKEVNEILPNYGKTLIGSGKFYWALDFGYARMIKRFSLLGEISLGGRNSYVNYKDSRFKGGAYYLVSKDKTGNALAGIGAALGYRIGNNFEVYSGYNTLHKFRIGIRFGIYSQK